MCSQFVVVFAFQLINVLDAGVVYSVNDKNHELE